MAFSCAIRASSYERTIGNGSAQRRHVAGTGPAQRDGTSRRAARRRHPARELFGRPAGRLNRHGPCAAETDSVAGHIGFELRCAERIFIFLRNRKGSNLRKTVQTVAPLRRIIFSTGLDCLLFARAFVERRTQRARSL
jgi:hypothetical protein